MSRCKQILSFLFIMPGFIGNGAFGMPVNTAVMNADRYEMVQKVAFSDDDGAALQDAFIKGYMHAMEQMGTPVTIFEAHTEFENFLRNRK